MPKKVAKKSSAKDESPDPEGDALLFGSHEKKQPDSDKAEDDKLDLLTDEDGYVEIHHDNITKKHHSSESRRLIERDDERLSIHLPVNGLFYERIAYWAVILVLVYFAVMGNFFNSENPVIEEIIEDDSASLAGSENVSDEEEVIVEEEPEPVVEEVKEAEPAPVTCPSGDVDVEVTRVRLDGNKIESIDVKVTNNDNADLSGFYIGLSYRYGSSDITVKPTAQSDYYRYTYNVGRCGGQRTVTLSSFLPSNVPSDSQSPEFTAVLYSSSTDEELARDASS